MGELDLEAFLRSAGTTREELVRDARAEAMDLAGTIHDEVQRLRGSLGRRPKSAVRASEEIADEIQGLLRELLTDLEILIVARDLTLKDVTVDDIHPAAVAPYLTIAVRAHLGARNADRTDVSPMPLSTARAAFDIAVDRVDRYVKGIATLFGEPIVDLPAEELNPQ
jgi:hypothetical protein